MTNENTLKPIAVTRSGKIDGRDQYLRVLAQTVGIDYPEGPESIALEVKSANSAINMIRKAQDEGKTLADIQDDLVIAAAFDSIKSGNTSELSSMSNKSINYDERLASINKSVSTFTAKTYKTLKDNAKALDADTPLDRDAAFASDTTAEYRDALNAIKVLNIVVPSRNSTHDAYGHLGLLRYVVIADDAKRSVVRKFNGHMSQHTYDEGLVRVARGEYEGITAQMPTTDEVANNYALSTKHNQNTTTDNGGWQRLGRF